MIFKNIRIKSASLTTPNENGKYQIVFAVDDKKDHKKLVDFIDEAWDEDGKGKPRNIAYFKAESSEEYPDDQDTGKIIFIASQNATNKEGTKSFSVKLFDAKNQPIKHDISVGAGTICNLSTSCFVWTYKKDMGVKLNLNGLQIVKLIEYSGGMGGDSFEAGDGYSADEFVKTDESQDEEETPKKKRKKKSRK